MSIYKNSYFNLCVPFSDDWRLRSWSNWKIEPEDQGRMQRYDDDIPCVEDEQKILFSSRRFIKGSQILLGNEFSMAVYWSENKFDLNARAPYKDNQINRTFKTGNLFGKKTQVRTIEHDCDAYVLTHEVVAWQAKPNLWLSACMTGDNRENFEEAQLQFSKLMYVLD